MSRITRPKHRKTVLAALIALTVVLVATAGVPVVADTVLVTAGTVVEAGENGPTVEIGEDLELDSPFQFPDNQTVDLSPYATIHSDGDTTLRVDAMTGEWITFTTHDVAAGVTFDPADTNAMTVTSQDIDTVEFRDVDVGSSDAEIAYSANGKVTISIHDTGLDPGTTVLARDADSGDDIDNVDVAANGSATFSLPAGDHRITFIKAGRDDPDRDRSDDEDPANGDADIIPSPTADAGGDQEVTVGESIVLDGSGSTGDGGIDEFHWDLGDGTTAAGEIVNHVYEAPGNYDVLLTVADAAGNEDTDSVTIVVTDTRSPDATFAVRDLTVDDAMPEVGDTITVEATVENVGDGAGTFVGTLIIDDEIATEETVDLSSGEVRTVAFTHTVDAPGEYEFTVGEASVTVVVSEVTEDDDLADDGSPGFGVVIALVAVVTVLARRR